MLYTEVSFFSVRGAGTPCLTSVLHAISERVLFMVVCARNYTLLLYIYISHLFFTSLFPNIRQAGDNFRCPMCVRGVVAVPQKLEVEEDSL